MSETTIFRCFVAAPLVSISLVLGLVGCGAQSSPVKQSAQDSSPEPAVENNLTFNDITLDQADDQGRPLWKVKAKHALYSQDKKTAQLQSPRGELFQDGKVAYKITGTQGEIQQDGKQLFLKGQIVATDPQNGVVMHGNELEWRPNEDLLIVRKHLTITHPQVQAVAQEAHVFSRAHRMELQDQVVAQAPAPQVQLRTEHLIWQIQAQKMISDRPVQIDRFKGKTITDRGTANQGEFNLKTKIAILKPNAQVSLLDPPLNIASNSISWNLNTEIVTADQPVRMVHRQQQLTASANRGRTDLKKKNVYLTGDAYAVGQRGQSIKANQLIWHLPSQEFEAEGNVFYRQLQPPVSFTGPKAFGKLQDQNIVVSGGRVVTDIVP